MKFQSKALNIIREFTRSSVSQVFVVVNLGGLPHYPFSRFGYPACAQGALSTKKVLVQVLVALNDWRSETHCIYLADLFIEKVLVCVRVNFQDLCAFHDCN
jgi:hypothetical protein